MAYGGKSAWKDDYKYGEAEKGVIFGKDKPVPLATIAFGKCELGNYVGFINGITRTIWLLANEASKYPVLCLNSIAKLLFEIAGADGTKIISVA